MDARARRLPKASSLSLEKHSPAPLLFFGAGRGAPFCASPTHSQLPLLVLVRSSFAAQFTSCWQQLDFSYVQARIAGNAIEFSCTDSLCTPFSWESSKLVPSITLPLTKCEMYFQTNSTSVGDCSTFYVCPAPSADVAAPPAEVRAQKLMAIAAVAASHGEQHAEQHAEDDVVAHAEQQQEADEEPQDTCSYHLVSVGNQFAQNGSCTTTDDNTNFNVTSCPRKVGLGLSVVLSGSTAMFKCVDAIECEGAGRTVTPAIDLSTLSECTPFFTDTSSNSCYADFICPPNDPSVSRERTALDGALAAMHGAAAATLLH